MPALTLFYFLSRYQRLSQSWTDVVARIRSLPNFEFFLKPTPFQALRAAAANGPVIVLNVSNLRTDAIIVLSNANPVLVPLPGASHQVISELAMSARSSTKDPEFKNFLGNLWKLIVQPIVQVLQADLLPGSRIWWCPTGSSTLLPLHAAGDYSKRCENLPALYISSYTPTLSALLRARSSVSAESGAAPRLLVVGQSGTPGQVPLPLVLAEIRRIRTIAPEGTTLEGSSATSEKVLEAMSQHPYIHLSCHGHVNHQQPFLSHFSLHDKPLLVSDLVKRKIPNAEFAFLSACHSAAGNTDTPDEVFHLTASLQFAGFRSVVGTMWAMVDDDGPEIAEAFYSSFLGHNVPKALSSAHALHCAVTVLRRKKVSPSRWACFVHFGC